jgi:hypothetical protein
MARLELRIVEQYYAVEINNTDSPTAKAYRF